MDPLALARMDVVEFARALIDRDSTTGREADVCRWVSAWLRERGWQVDEQPVAGDRVNLLATVGSPVVVLSTHLDCVPPFFPSRVEDGKLFGRGACDAKGILAAQVAAAERLRAAGERRVGLLFVVGEERGSDGALAAGALAAWSSYLVNGEPTDNRLGLATRGCLRVTLVARGRAAHSSYPGLGDSAIDKLVEALGRLRVVELPSDPVIGSTHYNVGLISGGVAPNVTAPEAQAELLFRTVGDGSPLFEIVERAVGGLVEARKTLDIPPVRLLTLAGFATESFPYTTDIPLLRAFGQPLLYGPGSALVAHTDDEHVPVSALHEAIDGYVRIATMLLAR